MDQSSINQAEWRNPDSWSGELPGGLIEVEIEPLNSGALLQTPLPPKVWTTSGRCVL